MITLITGVPGMGKSALVVSMMLDELKKGDRPFFVMGIPGLKLDYSPCPPVNEWTTQKPSVEDPGVIEDHFTFPPNSIVIIDECQKVYRPRASGSKVPPYVAAFETHRHRGLDFWLLTQKPSLLDSNVRDLVGRHIHIKEGFFTRNLYEWKEYTDVKNRAAYLEASKRKFQPPKQAFDLYKSAELHTKPPKRRLHQVFLYLALAVGFTVYNGSGIFSKIFAADLEPGQKKTALNAPPVLPSKPASVEPLQLGLAPVVAPQPLPAPVNDDDLLSGKEVQIKGFLSMGSKSLYLFQVLSGGVVLFDTDSNKLADAGYTFKALGECLGVLRRGDVRRTVLCGPASPQQLEPPTV